MGVGVDTVDAPQEVQGAEEDQLDRGVDRHNRQHPTSRGPAPEPQRRGGEQQPAPLLAHDDPQHRTQVLQPLPQGLRQPLGARQAPAGDREVQTGPGRQRQRRGQPAPAPAAVRQAGHQRRRSQQDAGLLAPRRQGGHHREGSVAAVQDEHQSPGGGGQQRQVRVRSEQLCGHRRDQRKHHGGPGGPLPSSAAEQAGAAGAEEGREGQGRHVDRVVGCQRQLQEEGEGPVPERGVGVVRQPSLPLRRELRVGPRGLGQLVQHHREAVLRDPQRLGHPPEQAILDQWRVQVEQDHGHGGHRGGQCRKVMLQRASHPGRLPLLGLGRVPLETRQCPTSPFPATTSTTSPRPAPKTATSTAAPPPGCSSSSAGC